LQTPKTIFKNELIGLGGMINKNQGAKQVANFKNIQPRARAWPF
jgi:hypothetical protein